MQSYGSFQSVSNLLRLIQLDYSIPDDLTSKYLSVPVSPSFDVCPPKGHVSAPPPPPVAPKKVKKNTIHIDGVSCVGTNRHGELCKCTRADGSLYCRFHKDQENNPKPPRVSNDDDENERASFSVHTPVHSRRPSVTNIDPSRQEAQNKFEEVARDRCGCGHLVKNVVLGGYEGVAIELGEHFVHEQMFRDVAKQIGLFLADVDGHMTPCGFMPGEEEEVVSREVVVDEVSDTEDEEPMEIPNTPMDYSDTECEEDEDPVDQLTEEAF